MLREPNIRRNMRILNTLKVPKNVKGNFEQSQGTEKCKKWDPLRFFNIHLFQNIKQKLKGRHFGEKN